jgi:flagellar motility protein MotE (MotC chaperone)
MAQPEPQHTEVDLSDSRRRVKRVLRDLEEVNRDLARKDERIRDLEARLAAEYGIAIERSPKT